MAPNKLTRNLRNKYNLKYIKNIRIVIIKEEKNGNNNGKTCECEFLKKVDLEGLLSQFLIEMFKKSNFKI